MNGKKCSTKLLSKVSSRDLESVARVVGLDIGSVVVEKKYVVDEVLRLDNSRDTSFTDCCDKCNSVDIVNEQGVP